MTSFSHQPNLRKPIYLDYAASTPVAPQVAAKMVECLTMEGNFANPASRSHGYGWQAEEAVEHARAQVASLIGADAREIVWTSGATEANNLALKGASENYRLTHKTGGHIVTSAVEHKAVLDPVAWLEKNGFSVTLLMPNSDGIVTAENLQNALRDDTFLVSIMQVNNELGCINDIPSLSKVCLSHRESHRILFHCDASQSAGKIALDVNELGVDFLSLSAHKFYGPKGVGALYVRRSGDIKVAAQIHGGGHERGMRSGTLATHQCVGMGEAAELAAKLLTEDVQRIAHLRDKLWQGICDLPNVKRNGSCNNSPLANGALDNRSVDKVACGHLNISFANAEGKGCNGETLLLSLRELAVSSGSACNSASLSPSYVLRAIGLNETQAEASLRFSIGRYTTSAEIEFAIEHIRSVVARLNVA